MSDDESWTEYRRLVIKSLDELSRCYDELGKEIGKLRTDVAMLQVKAGIWGLLAGVLGVGVMALAKKIGGD